MNRKSGKKGIIAASRLVSDVISNNCTSNGIGNRIHVSAGLTDVNCKNIRKRIRIIKNLKVLMAMIVKGKMILGK
jgi:hypothetical protein